MNIWSSRSLAVKLLLPLCAALSLGLAISTIVVTRESSRETTALSMSLGRAAADQAAQTVSLRFETAAGLARMAAEEAASLVKAKADRRELGRVALAAARTAPDLVGVWIDFAPNAYDGADQQHLDPNELTHDAKGRTTFYAINSAEGAALQSTVDSTTDMNTVDYFAIPFKTGKEAVIEPYLDTVSGKSVLMTSLAVPIIVDGKTLGVAGVDIALDKLAAEIGTLKPLGDGSVNLVSAGGVWVSHETADWLGKKIDETDAALAPSVAQAKQGRGLDAVMQSEAQGEVHRLLRPIALGHTEAPWVLISNLRSASIDAPTRSITTKIEISSVVLVVVLALTMTLLVRLFAARPVQALSKAVHDLAGGNTAIAVPGTERGDELGFMAKAVEFFRQKLIEVEELRRRKSAAAEQAALEARREEMLKLADTFELSVQNVVKAVSASSVELETNAQAMATISKTAARQAVTVSEATTTTSGSVTAVASASEELSASISEISRQVNDSTGATKDAAEEVDATGTTITALATAAAEIGGIVALIGDIAAQTNLLALNATIEAARAGEAGKGFAVVAAEVKSLANQTAKAAEEITGRISRIQSTTEHAVKAMDGVKQIIARVNEIAATISSAVDQQASATREISSNATQAASGTEEVARNIGDVSRAVEDAGSAAAQVLATSGELAKQAQALRHGVDQFIVQVRAA
jgi:methyl-accepting chemotaxis protein